MSVTGFYMPIRKYNPTSPGRRFQTVQVFDEITTQEPYKPLVEPLRKSGGRNNHGELTSWWRGGGHKRNYRIIDFKREKREIPATVSTIEYYQCLGGHYAGERQINRRALQLADAQMVEAVLILQRGAHCLQAIQVVVDRARADAVAARRGDDRVSGAMQQWAGRQHSQPVLAPQRQRHHSVIE